MKLPPLVEATLLRRYKRFLADVRLPDGTELTAHCPNPGRMTSCARPDIPCRISHHPGKGRKLEWTLQQTCMDGTWILVNTALPNGIVDEAIRAGRIPELAGYESLEREVRLPPRPDGKSSRIDLRLQGPDRPACWVEVKNVTLLDDDGVLRFPDAVSARATKHLEELVALVEAGERAVLFFHVGRGDGSHVEPAEAIDPVYAAAIREAVGKGVEVVAYRGEIGVEAIEIGEAVEVRV